MIVSISVIAGVLLLAHGSVHLLGDRDVGHDASGLAGCSRAGTSMTGGEER